MNEIYRKSLIKNAEESFKEFYAFCETLIQDDTVDKDGKAQSIKAFLNLQTAIEEDVLEMRLRKIIERENPYLPAIKVVNLETTDSDENQSLNDIISGYLEQKKKLIKFLYNVPFYYWDRTGFHEFEGHVSFEEFIRRMIRNDKKNFSQIIEQTRKNSQAVKSSARS